MHHAPEETSRRGFLREVSAGALGAMAFASSQSPAAPGESPAAKVAALFEHARATGFADWDALLRQLSPAVVRKADEPRAATR